MKKLLRVLGISLLVLFWQLCPAHAVYQQTRTVNFNFSKEYGERSVLVPLGLDDTVMLDPEDFTSESAMISVYPLDRATVLEALVYHTTKTEYGYDQTSMDWSSYDFDTMTSTLRTTLGSLASKNYQIELPGNGAWWVCAVEADKRQCSLVTKTRFGSMVKNGDESLVLWSQDLATGHDKFDGTAKIYNFKDGVYLLEEIAFDDDRLVTLPYREDADAIVVMTGEDWNLIPLHIREIGIDNLWSTNGSYSIYHSNERDYVFTDKPLYQRGDTVYFKAFLRRDDDARYSVVSDLVTVAIDDGYGKDPLFVQSYTPDAYGGIDGEFVIPDDAEYDYYRLKLSTGGSTGFSVREYVKPEYELYLSIDNDEIITGETLIAEVSGVSFSGYLMNNQSFEYCWTKGYNYSFTDVGDCDSWQGAAFDNEGHATLEIPVDLPPQNQDDDDRYHPSSENYYLVVRYSDGVSEPALDVKNFQVYYTPFEFVLPSDEYWNNRISGYDDYDARDYDVYRHNYFDFEAGEPLSLAGTVKSSRDQVSVANRRVVLTITQTEYNYDGNGSSRLIEKTTLETRTDSTGKFDFAYTPTTCAGRELSYRIYDDQGHFTERGSYRHCEEKQGLATTVKKTIEKDLDTTLTLVLDEKQAYKPDQQINVEYQVGNGLVGREYFADFGRQRLDRYVVGTFNSKNEKVAYTIQDSDQPNTYHDISLFSRNNYLSSTSRVTMDKELKHISVQLTTDQDTYAPGDTVKVKIKTTNASTGNAVSASVTVWTIDKALYELARSHRSEIFGYFWSDRYHWIRTYHSLEELSVYGAEGGGGGGGDIRDIFKDNAYWNPRVITDQNGEATLEFQLPDNLTTWILTGVAANDNTLVGENETEFVVQKEVVARIIAPERLRVGDVSRLGFLITNYSATTQTFRPVWETGEGLRTDDTFPDVITLAPGETAIYTVPVTATSEIASIQITAGIRNVISGQPDDVLVKTLEILPYGYEQKTSQFSLHDGSFKLGLAADSDLSRSSATLSLAGDILASLKTAMNDLLTYPRGCVEQTTSRLIPVLIVRDGRLFREDNFDVDLDELTREGIENLHDLQNSDGGWGFWAANGDSHPFKTAYVVKYLTQADTSHDVYSGNVLSSRQDGATPVSSWVMRRAGEYLDKAVRETIFTRVAVVNDTGDTSSTTTTTTTQPVVTRTRSTTATTTSVTTDDVSESRTSRLVNDSTKASDFVSGLYGLMLLGQRYPDLTIVTRQEIDTGTQSELNGYDLAMRYYSYLNNNTFDLTDIDILSWAVQINLLANDQTNAKIHLDRMLDLLETNYVAATTENLERYRSEQSDLALALQAVVAYQARYSGYGATMDRLVTRLLGLRGQAGWSNTYATAQAIEALSAWSSIQSSVSNHGSYMILLGDEAIGVADFSGSTREKTFTIPLDDIPTGHDTLTIRRTDGGDEAPLYVTLSVNQWRTSNNSPLENNRLAIHKAYVRTNARHGEPLEIGDIVTVYLGLENRGTTQFYVNIDDYVPSNLRPLYRNNNTWANRTFTFNGFNGTLYRLSPGMTVISYQAVVTNLADQVSALPTYVGSMYDSDFVAQTAMTDRVQIVDEQPDWIARAAEVYLDDETVMAEETELSGLVSLIARIILLIMVIIIAIVVIKTERRRRRRRQSSTPVVAAEPVSPTTTASGETVDSSATNDQTTTSV